MGADQQQPPPNGTPRTRPTLLLRVRDWKDEEAWRTFVEIYQPLILGQCGKCGLQPADADEVAQEVLSRVADAIRTFDYDPQRGRFRSWLFAVARSRIAEHFASKVRQPRPVGSSAPVPVTTASEPEWERDYVERVFDWACAQVRGDVKPNTWQAFHATAVENRPVERVAAELGMSVGAIYIARSRMIARIRQVVRDATGEEIGL